MAASRFAGGCVVCVGPAPSTACVGLRKWQCSVGPGRRSRAFRLWHWGRVQSDARSVRRPCQSRRIIPIDCQGVPASWSWHPTVSSHGLFPSIFLSVSTILTRCGRRDVLSGLSGDEVSSKGSSIQDAHPPGCAMRWYRDRGHPGKNNRGKDQDVQRLGRSEMTLVANCLARFGSARFISGVFLLTGPVTRKDDEAPSWHSPHALRPWSTGGYTCGALHDRLDRFSPPRLRSEAFQSTITTASLPWHLRPLTLLNPNPGPHPGPNRTATAPAPVPIVGCPATLVSPSHTHSAFV